MKRGRVTATWGSLSRIITEKKRIPKGFRTNPPLGEQIKISAGDGFLDWSSLDLILLVIEVVGRELRIVWSDLQAFEAVHSSRLMEDKDADWPQHLQNQTAKCMAEILAFKNSK